LTGLNNTAMRDEIKELFRELSLHAGRLTQGQLDFVKGLQYYYSRYKTLSDKQYKILLEIRNSIAELVVTGQKLSA